MKLLSKLIFLGTSFLLAQQGYGMNYYSEPTEYFSWPKPNDQQKAKDQLDEHAQIVQKYFEENPCDIPEDEWCAGVWLDRNQVIHTSHRKTPKRLLKKLNNENDTINQVSDFEGFQVKVFAKKKSPHDPADTTQKLLILSPYVNDDKAHVCVAPKTIVVPINPIKKDIQRITLSIPWDQFRNTQNFRQLKALQTLPEKDKAQCVALLDLLSERSRELGLDSSYLSLKNHSTMSECAMDCYTPKDWLIRKLHPVHAVRTVYPSGYERCSEQKMSEKLLPFRHATAAVDRDNQSVVLSITSGDDDERLTKVSKTNLGLLIKHNNKNEEMIYPQEAMFYDGDTLKVQMPEKLRLSPEDSLEIAKSLSNVYTAAYRAGGVIDLRPLERLLEEKLRYKEKQQAATEAYLDNDGMTHASQEVISLTVCCDGQQIKALVSRKFEQSVTSSLVQNKVISHYLPDAESGDTDHVLSSLFSPMLMKESERLINLQELVSVIEKYGEKKSFPLTANYFLSEKAKRLAANIKTFSDAKAKKDSSTEGALQKSRAEAIAQTQEMIKVTENALVDNKKEEPSPLPGSVLTPPASTSTATSSAPRVKIASQAVSHPIIIYSSGPAVAPSSTASRFFLFRWAASRVYEINVIVGS